MTTTSNGTYRRFFVKSCKHFEETVEKRLKSSNTIKLKGDSLFRTISFPDISIEMFRYNLRKSFLDTDEIEAAVGKRNSALYGINTLERLVSKFGTDSLLKRHHQGDISLISPLMKLRENFTFDNFGKSEVFESGHIVIPIKPVVLIPDRMLCFLPSPGYNDDDEIDWWVKDIPLIDLGLNVNPELLTKKKYDGVSPVQFIKNDDGGYIEEGLCEKLADNDYLKLTGNWYQIRGISNLREKPGYVYVRLNRTLLNNCSTKSIVYVKYQCFKGTVVTIPNSSLTVYRSVTFQMVKMDENDYGTMEIKMQNSTFNKYGFYPVGCY